jgi:tetratricopeptide (TPR) repeat protein
LRGYASEGRGVIRAALALPGIQASDIAQAHALYVGAALATSQSDHGEARRMLETCLQLRRELGGLVDIAATLSTLSVARLQAGDANGAAIGEREALQIFRQLGDRFGEAIGLLHLGQIGVYLGQDEQACSDLQQCLAIAREIHHLEIEGECELILGESAFEVGERSNAMQRFNRSLTVCRGAGDRRGEANALWWLGKGDLQLDNLASARSRLSEALREFRAFEMWEELLGCLEDFAALAHKEGWSTDALRVGSAAAKSRDTLGLARQPRAELRWQRMLDALRAIVPAGDFDAAWSEGREWQIDQAIRRALSTRTEAVTA